MFQESGLGIAIHAGTVYLNVFLASSHFLTGNSENLITINNIYFCESAILSIKSMLIFSNRLFFRKVKIPKYYSSLK